MQAFHRGAWAQGQYRPLNAGVSCAAARCRMHVLNTQRDMVADLHTGLYLNRGAGILSGRVGARPVPAFTCRCLLCGGARAKDISRHRRGLAFGLYLNRGAGILSGCVGARPVPARTCRRLLCGGAFWGARTKHASRHGRGLAFGLYLNRDAGILSGAWVQGQYRPVRAGVSCAAVRCGGCVC